MNWTRLFFTICIFLSAVSSIDAQDWAMEAVECERQVFEADNPQSANEALIRKALCYRKMNDYSKASESLERVRMYLMEPEERNELLLNKALCSAKAQNTEDALSCLEQIIASGTEAGAEIKSQLDELQNSRPAPKSEDRAMLLAMLPPLGHCYTDNYKEGAVSLALNALAAGWTLWQCLEGCWISGLLGGGIALDYTYMGGIGESIALVGKYNDEQKLLFNEALLALICAHIPAE